MLEVWRGKNLNVTYVVGSHNKNIFQLLEELLDFPLGRR